MKLRTLAGSWPDLKSARRGKDIAVVKIIAVFVGGMIVEGLVVHLWAVYASKPPHLATPCQAVLLDTSQV